MALHNCPHPGCSNLTLDRYCAEHASDRDRYRGSRIERGYDEQWLKFRARYIIDHPLCTDCLSTDQITPAREVHHIHKLRDGGAKFDINNVMALCSSCHAKRTGKGE